MSDENYISKEELKSTLSDLYTLTHILNVIFTNIFSGYQETTKLVQKQKDNAHDAVMLLREIILHLENNEITSF